MAAYQVIDCHAHLEEVADVAQQLERAKQVGVTAIIAVGSGQESNRRTMELAQKHKGLVYPALGLHPGQLKEEPQWQDTCKLIEDRAEDTVAIGEIGLDFHYRWARHSPQAQEEQKQALRQLLQIAKDKDKPVLLHAREAWEETFALVRGLKLAKVVFHWYSGPVELLQDILRAGYYISATPAADYSPSHREAIRNTPLAQLLLETDCPVVYRGVVSGPAHVLNTLGAVARLLGQEMALIAEKTTANARLLFGLPGEAV